MADTPSQIESRRAVADPRASALGLSAPWRKVLGDLWASKMRTLLAVISISIGVFAVGGVMGAFVLLNRDLDRSYQATSPAAATIYASPVFDESLLATVRHVPGVAAVEGANNFVVRARTGTDSWRSISLMVVDDLTRMQVNQVRSDSGDWPVADRELILERSSQSLLPVTIGQMLEIELPDGTRRTLRVGGIAHDGAAIPAVFMNTPSGFINFDTLEWLGGGTRSYTRMYVRLQQPGATLEQVKAVMSEISDRITRSGRSYYIDISPPGESPVQSGSDAMGLVLTTLAALLVFLSMFLIVNTVAALLLQQRRQIGVMKAIGAETRQIVAMYLAFALCLGMLSLMLAVPLGALFAYSVAGFLAQLLNFNLGSFELAPHVVATQAVIAFAVPTLAALAPVLDGTRITIREAISNPGLGRGRFGKSMVDRLLEHVRFLSRPLLLALRNTFRRKGRLALTLLTLSLAGAIFIGVGSTQQSFNLQVDAFMSYFGEDVRVNFDRPYRIDRVTQLAMETPGVAHTEIWIENTIYRMRPDGSEGDSMFIRASERGSELIRPHILRGRWLLEDDENALVVDTKFLKQEPDLDVGSRVKMRMGEIDSEWVIVGLIPQMGNAPSFAYTSYDAISRLSHNVGWTGDLRVVGTSHDPAAQKGLADRLSQHFKDSGILVHAVETNASYRQGLDQQFGVITRFLVIMAVMIGVVGGIGLMGTMSMNVVERTREIGVLRAVGASDQDVQLIIVVEGILIGLLSWAVATLVALPISRLLSFGIGMAFMNNPLPNAFDPASVLIWLGIVLVLAALSSILPAWNASRLTVREVLAYE